MKRILLSALALLAFVVTLQAQNSNAVFFTENGEQFYVVLNGLRMNDVPATNVKVTDLNQPGYKLKVIFENADLGEMDKNLYLNEAGNETVFVIKKNKKGEWKLGYQSSVPIAQAPPAPATQRVIVFGAPAPQPVLTTGGVIVEETVTTTTTTGGGGTGDNVNMSVGINGFGMDVNVNTNAGGMNTNSSMTTTTTTTTTTAGNVGMVQTNELPPPCMGMEPGEFNNACSSIRAKSFSDSKMTLAKQIVRGHCVSSVQVRDMVKLFDFETDRLEFAKFAFDYTADQNNYYKINDAFDFESSIDELDEYIHGR